MAEVVIYQDRLSMAPSEEIGENKLILKDLCVGVGYYLKPHTWTPETPSISFDYGHYGLVSARLTLDEVDKIIDRLIEVREKFREIERKEVNGLVDWKELIGKRILVKKYGMPAIYEEKVEEVSPSGKYVKLGNGKWYSIGVIDLVEVLEDEESTRKER
jgi:hypothetical protein